MWITRRIQSKLYYACYIKPSSHILALIFTSSIRKCEIIKFELYEDTTFTVCAHKPNLSF